MQLPSDPPSHGTVPAAAEEHCCYLPHVVGGITLNFSLAHSSCQWSQWLSPGRTGEASIPHIACRRCMLILADRSGDTSTAFIGLIEPSTNIADSVRHVPPWRFADLREGTRFARGPCRGAVLQALLDIHLQPCKIPILPILPQG